MNEITIGTDGGHDYMTATISQGNLERIRQHIIGGRALKVYNGHVGPGGSPWGEWLQDGTKDIATADILRTYDYYGLGRHDRPSVILLTPKR